MDEITTIGIDLAKNVFQVHAVDASGAVVSVRRWVAYRLSASFGLCRPALSAWRRVRRRTIGHGRSPRSGMRFD